MADAVDEARSLLQSRRDVLAGELKRIDRALSALDADSPRGNSRSSGVTLGPNSIRRRVLTVMESAPRAWTPAEMAHHLETDGQIENADASIKVIRTAFWSLRGDKVAASFGTGRNTRTYSTKWSATQVA